MRIVCAKIHDPNENHPCRKSKVFLKFDFNYHLHYIDDNDTNRQGYSGPKIPRFSVIVEYAYAKNTEQYQLSNRPVNMDFCHFLEPPSHRLLLIACQNSQEPTSRYKDQVTIKNIVRKTDCSMASSILSCKILQISKAITQKYLVIVLHFLVPPNKRQDIKIAKGIT